MTLIAIICAFLRKAARSKKGRRSRRGRRWSAFRESLGDGELAALMGPLQKHAWRIDSGRGGGGDHGENDRAAHGICTSSSRVPDSPLDNLGVDLGTKKRDEKSFNKVHSFRLLRTPCPHYLRSSSSSSPADTHYNASRSRTRQKYLRASETAGEL